jgi:RNA polymerase sigma-70 factor (sigma-E family)
VGADIVSLARPPEVLEIGPGDRLPEPPGRLDADLVLTALYQEHAVGLVRLAFVMLNDRPAAEDVVQEAFCGLYRRWSHLSDPAKSLPYVRSAVLNGCRSVLRQRARRDSRVTSEPPAASAEANALIGEEHRAVLAGLRLLPPRQREALVLRFFLDLDETEIASSMAISRGTVKSTLSRGLAALGQILGDGQ